MDMNLGFMAAAQRAFDRIPCHFLHYSSIAVAIATPRAMLALI